MVRIPVMPQSEPVYEDYTLRLDGSEAFHPLACRVSALPFNIWWSGHQRPESQTELAAFCSFEMQGETLVELDIAHSYEDITIRPQSAGIIPKCEGSHISFTLPHPGQYTVEFDGFHHALHLFANPMKDFAVPQDALVFGPGVHHPGIVDLHSGQTVYLDPGAVVYGCLRGACADNITILGYGILDGSWETRTDETCLLPYSYEQDLPDTAEELLAFMNDQNDLHGCLRFYRGHNISVEGPILRDCATFCCIPANVENLSISWLKTIGMWRYNSDGIDLFNCRNVSVSHCFLRNFDDCMVIKGICGWNTWNNENILVQHCTVWCDWGRALEIGAETNAPEYRNILFEDCDLIHGSTVMMDIQHHNNAEVHHVLFKNIRCEYTRYQMADALDQNDVPYEVVSAGKRVHPFLMVAEVRDSSLFASKKDYKNGRIHDIAFEDITVYADEGLSFPVSYFAGVSPELDVRNVSIKNVVFNNRRLGADEIIIDEKPFAQKPCIE